MPPPLNKPQLLRNMECAFERLFPEVPANKPGVCLYWAVSALQVLEEEALSPQLMAGSMSWPILPPHLDDGVSPTHFTYEFEPDHPMSLFAMAQGHLPEMHVWVRLEDTREIVDPSTRFLKEHFHQMMPHMKWRTKKPPNCLWSSKLPSDVYYRPHPDAVAIAKQAAKCLGVAWPVSRDFKERG